MIGDINPCLNGYGFSILGRSHANNGTPCQDNHLHTHRSKRWHLLAIADGVGSANYCAEGAKIALNSLELACFTLLLQQGEENILETLKIGFCNAVSNITNFAQQSNIPVNEYDTTLTACIFDGSVVFIGHVGDGGVIGIDDQGEYTLLTKQQRGENCNEVLPLRSGEDTWVFEKIELPFTGIILLTDGLLDYVAPSLLFGQNQTLYCGFLQHFLSPSMILNEIATNYCDEIKENLIVLLAQKHLSHLIDDLTAVALWRCGGIQKIPSKEYYQEPNWQLLYNARYAKLFPHLLSSETEEISHDSQKPSR